MPTFSVRIPTQDQKENLDAVLKKAIDQIPEANTQAEALDIIFKVFTEGIETLDKSRFKSKSAQDIIDEIQCPYLQYDGNWSCLELVHRTKKKKDLGWNAEETLALCKSCQLGKTDQVKKEVEKQLRKKNIKDITQLRDLFIQQMDEGGPVKLWICKADLLQKHEIQICSDMINLKCPFNEYQEVSIQHFCSTQINPETNNPPCPHLKLRIITGRIESRQTRDIIEKIYLEHQQDQITPQQPKTVESEQIEEEKEEEK